jgi:transcriptional regulator with XRE-family HTH domain
MTHTNLEKALAFAGNPAATLEVSALQAASPIVLALAECDDDLRAEAIELFKQLSSGELDEEQRFATTALLAEILFPRADHQGMFGLDLAEAEAISPAINPEAKDVLDRMDHEEAAFAQRLRDLMDAKGLTQAELAEKLGIGQPAISMMLNRTCRPQRATVIGLAQALGVLPEELWPDFYQPSRDYTKYDVTINGVTHRRLAKRQAILQVVKHLVLQGGVPPEEIAERLSWYPRELFQCVEGEVGPEEFVRTVREAKGGRFDANRYFCEGENLIVSAGKTYALSNQWGRRTPQALEALLSAFPDKGVSCQVSAPTS